MIYVSPVNNHAFTILRIPLRDGVGKAYQLFETESGTDKRYSMVRETYELDEALEWLGIKIRDFKSIIQIEEAE